MTKINEKSVNLKIALFGGTGIGLLFGVIMGTSITPTVTTLFGALATLLAAILGLNDKHFTDAKAIRVGSFGIACVIGAYLGLFVRANNVFSPSIIDMKQEYIKVGFSEQQALNFIAFKEFGISLTASAETISSPVNSTLAAEQGVTEVAAQPSNAVMAMTNSHANKQHSSVLFSAPVALSGCDELEHTDASLPLDEVLNNFELTGGAWNRLTGFITNDYQENQQKPLLLTVRDAVCQVEKLTNADCKLLTSTLNKSVMNDTTFKATIAPVKELDAQWRTIAGEIELSALEPSLKLAALGLANILVCGP